MTLSARVLMMGLGIGGLAAMAACTQVSTTGSLPAGEGVTCTSTASASDAASMKSTLASAAAGTCVVVPAGNYAGPVTVPAGVSLVAQNGQRGTITGGTAQEPSVSLGEGSQLVGFDVVDAGGVAIAVRAANALVSDVNVTGAKNAALAVLCKAATTPGCATGTISIANTTLSTSGLGLWVSGAHVAWKGGGSTNHAGTSLAAAAGIVAQDGAKLELDTVNVEKNQGVGILIDGAATTAGIKNITVNENGERGIWAQGVAGTLDAPAVKIENSQITKNKIVGVGAVQSHGIIIVGGRVAESVAAPLVTNLASTEMIGDGVGMFAKSGDFKVDSVTIESNARAAGIFDGSERGIIIVGGTVAAGASGLKVVVQNSTSAMVQVSSDDLSTPPMPLGVSAPMLTLPPVL